MAGDSVSCNLSSVLATNEASKGFPWFSTMISSVPTYPKVTTGDNTDFYQFVRMPV